jgi:plastocyanin
VLPGPVPETRAKATQRFLHRPARLIAGVPGFLLVAAALVAACGGASADDDSAAILNATPTPDEMTATPAGVPEMTVTPTATAQSALAAATPDTPDTPTPAPETPTPTSTPTPTVPPPTATPVPPTPTPTPTPTPPPAPTATPTATYPDAVTIAVRDNFFAPATNVIIAVGGTVTWVWQGDIPHDVESTDGAFHSSALKTEGTHHATFSTPGIYNYRCSIHPPMRGVIEVR